jgi:hypothetical protein
MRKVVFAMSITASLLALSTTARAQVLMYNCGVEFSIRADITNQYIVWITPDGAQEVHRAQIDAAYISWDMRSPIPMRIDRKTGLAERWASGNRNWENTGSTCSLEK